MKKYYVHEVKFGESEGGISCGPVSGSLVASVKYSVDGDVQWLSMVEFDGFPNFYLSDKDIYDDLVKEDFEDKEFTEYMQDHQIDEFDGISIWGEYDDVFEGLAEAPENPAGKLIRYLVALVRCSEEEVNGLIAMATDKNINDIVIPMSEIEKEWLSEQEEYEEEYPENMKIEGEKPMKKYYIEEAKCGVTDAGMESTPVAAIKVKEANGTSEWLSLIEADGIPIVFQTTEDMFDKLIANDQSEDDGAYYEFMDAHTIHDFNGIVFGEDYTETFDSISEDPDNPAIPLIRYLIALERCDMEEIDDLVNMAVGKYADELEIPMSDVEEEWAEAMEEDED